MIVTEVVAPAPAPPVTVTLSAVWAFVDVLVGLLTSVLVGLSFPVDAPAGAGVAAATCAGGSEGLSAALTWPKIIKPGIDKASETRARTTLPVSRPVVFGIFSILSLQSETGRGAPEPSCRQGMQLH